MRIKTWTVVWLFFLLPLTDISSALAQETGTTGKGIESQGQSQLINKLEDMQKKIDKLEAESTARKKLQSSDEEKQQKEKEVLSSAGREYSLQARGTLELEYGIGYVYNSTDVIQQSQSIEKTYDHTITHTITGSYGILNNLSFRTAIPFVYRYNQIGTKDEQDESDIGDISVSLSCEPLTKPFAGCSVIVNASVALPTGKSPYKIDPSSELSTGSGNYAFTAGLSLSKPLDPMVVFGSVSYTYSPGVRGIDSLFSGQTLKDAYPGDTISVGAGFGYSISYVVSFSQQVAYTFVNGSKYKFQTSSAETAAYSSAAYVLGAGWRVSTKTTVFTSLEIGLTSDRPDFSFSVRVPINYVL